MVQALKIGIFYSAQGNLDLYSFTPIFKQNTFTLLRETVTDYCGKYMKTFSK